MHELATLRGERIAGAVLARTGPVAGLAVAGVAVAGAVLVPVGLWRPAVVWPVLLVVLAGAWRLAMIVPSRAVADPALPAVPQTVVPVWSAAATIALSAGFVLWAALTRAEQVIVRRDAGAYTLYTQWIATRHGLPIADRLEAFGGAAAYGVRGFTLDSPAFYQVLHGAGPGVGADVVPQFLVGSPAVFSLGWWTGSLVGHPWTGLQLVPPVLGGLALMAFGGLAARLVGPRWTPLAVAALGLSLPVLHAARATYSEPAALLLVLAAACLLVDALALDTPRGARLGLLAGLVLGLANLVRVDAVREVSILLPCCALLAARARPGTSGQRGHSAHRAAVPLAVGALAGTAFSIADWLLLSRPYLRTVSASLVPLLAATLLITVLAAVAVPIARRRVPSGPTPLGSHRVSTSTVIAMVLAVGVALAVRPLVSTTRQSPDDPGARFVASLQAGQGLPVDGGRTYAEHSLEWVAWYSGWIALAAAWVVLAVLAGRAVRWWRAGSDAQPQQGSQVPAWLVPAVVAFGSTVLVLYRPGITPDHPWADRRLVPIVLPTVALAATAAVAWAVRYARRRAPAGLLVASVVVGVSLVLAPEALATGPLAGQRTEVGEPAAVAAVCATLAPKDVVATVDGTADGHGQRSANEWVQVIRGVCGHPSAALLTPAAELPRAVAELAALARSAGGRLVLLTAQEDDAAARRVLALATGPGAAEAGMPRRVVQLVTQEDLKLLTRRPAGSARLVVDVWTIPIG